MPTLLKILLSISALLWIPTAAWAQGYQVLEMVGKSPGEVEKILGSANSCSDARLGLTCEYQDKTVQVVYIDDKSDWITFAGLPEMNFDYHALDYIGLAVVPPFVHNPVRMHWQYHHGLEVVSVYGNGQNVAMIEVRAYTPK